MDPILPCNGAVIFLHGLGEEGRQFIDKYNIPEAFDRDDLAFIFPNAPKRNVTIYNMTMPAWFDAIEKGINAREDTEGILQMTERITELIQDKVKNYCFLEQNFRF